MKKIEESSMFSEPINETLQRSKISRSSLSAQMFSDLDSPYSTTEEQEEQEEKQEDDVKITPYHCQNFQNTEDIQDTTSQIVSETYQIPKTEQMDDYSTTFKQKQNIKNELKYTEYNLKCKELFDRYEYLDTVPGQSVKQIVVGLMSIAEVVFKQIPGEERMQRVLQTYEMYLNTKNIQLDAFSKNLLRQFCQVCFDKYKKVLKNYYNQLFNIVSFLGACVSKIII